MKTQSLGKTLQIFCQSRMKWVALTPEEWVRQHAVSHLIQYNGFSASLIKVEANSKEMGLDRRADILVYDSSLNLKVLVECKAPWISLDQSVADQAMRYAQRWPAAVLILTNGMEHLSRSGEQEQWKSHWPILS